MTAPVLASANVEDALIDAMLPYLDTTMNLVTDLRKVAMPDKSPTTPNVIALYKITGTERAPGLEQSTVGLDVYARTRLEAADLAHWCQGLLLRNLQGADTPVGMLSHIQLLAGVAERPYINDNVYRFGLDVLVTLHGHLF